MKIFTSRDSLNQLDRSDPAYPVVDDLIRVIMDSDPSYRTEDHGFLALVEVGDHDQPLTSIDWPEFTLASLPYEGITWQDGFYIAVVLCNNDYGVVFIIPDADWIGAEPKEVIEKHLDTEII